MRHLIAFLFFCVASVAQAADISAIHRASVAPAAPACTSNYCVGFQAGADVWGVATNANIFLNGIGGSFNGGGTRLGGHAGYRYYDGKLYVGFDAGCSYDVSAGTSGLGISPSDRLFCLEQARLGGSISSLFGGTAPVQFPAVLQQYFMSAYITLGAAQRLSATGLSAGVGAEFALGGPWTARLEYTNVQYGSGGATDPSAPGFAVKSENLFRLAVDYNF